MVLKNRQRGMTAIGWLIVLSIVGFFALLLLKLVPLYIEFYSVRNALESLQHQPSAGDMTKDDIKNYLYKQFTINQVSRANLDKDLKIERDEKTEARHVTIQYDVAEPVAGNVDALVHFKHSVVLKDGG